MSTHRLPVPGRLASAGKHWGGPGPRTLLGALALVVLLGAECQPVPTPTPGATGGAAPAAMGGSGGWEPFDTGGAAALGGSAPASPCVAYCARLDGMGCPEAADQPSCVAQCQRIVRQPDIATLDLDAGTCTTKRAPAKKGKP